MLKQRTNISKHVPHTSATFQARKNVSFSAVPDNSFGLALSLDFLPPAEPSVPPRRLWLSAWSNQVISNWKEKPQHDGSGPCLSVFLSQWRGNTRSDPFLPPVTKASSPVKLYQINDVWSWAWSLTLQSLGDPGLWETLFQKIK